ncbi:MAG: DnaA ATPase domain-containing protein [Elusimicrobiota bacterium]
MNKSDFSTAGLKAGYSFDQLVIGPNNHVAAAACRAVIEKPGDAYNPLYIYGPSGVGKTHLIQAAAQEILRMNPHSKVKYVSAERFISDVVMALSEDRVLELRRSYCQLDILILDDVQYLAESKIAQEEMFHIFNNLHHDNKQIIFAADSPPNLLSTLTKNVRSRMEWGLATDVKTPDYSTRFKILKKKQMSQGIEIPDEMLQYAAQVLRSSVRELEGFLKRIHAYVTLSRQKISLELVQSVVKEISPFGTPEPITEEVPLPEPLLPPVEVAAEKVEVKDEEIIPVLPSPVISFGSNGHKENAVLQEFSDLPASFPDPVVNSSEDVSFDTVLDSMAIDMADEKKAEKKVIYPEPVMEEMPTPEMIEMPTTIPIEDNMEMEIEEPVQTIEPVKPVVIPKVEVIQEPVLQAKAAPTPKEPPKVEATVIVPELQPLTEEGEVIPGIKEVSAVFFYPDGHQNQSDIAHQKFQEVIRKHKLKFRLKRMSHHPYIFKGKINYAAFVDACKDNHAAVAIVIGPPLGASVREQDFYDLLNITLDVQGISLQIVNWLEIDKDYRYLNLSLDIALVRTK